MKILNGRELASYIKERQARQVRGLVQSSEIIPKLAIIKTKDDPVIETYVRLKQRYGKDVGIEVEIFDIQQSQAKKTIRKLNKDNSFHGIIVQLPLDNEGQTREILDLVTPEKDVDGLAVDSKFDPATPTAILWLLAGYDIDLRGKKFAIVGKGLLVGAPLAYMLEISGHHIVLIDKKTKGIDQILQDADIIVTATGQAGLINNEMVTPQTVIVDAGVAVQSGQTVGDVAQEVYEREDLKAITPQKGGVGPLTVCALFENVIKAARIESIND